jgi:anti-sigma factor RsiW
MGEFNDIGCAGLTAVAAELALGALTGHERAEALAHLDRCEVCRERVSRLMVTSGELLELLPASEPPPGFEVRVMERLGLAAFGRAIVSQASRVGHLRQRRGRRQREPGRNRRLLAVAAAAVVVAGLGGWGMGSGMSPAGHVPLSSAALVSPGHRAVGEIFAYGGSQEWVYVSVDVGAGNGAVVFELVGKDNHVTTVGSFILTGGYGSWGSPYFAGGSPSGARLVAPDGTVLATATFAS